MVILEDTREQGRSENALFSELTKQGVLIQAAHMVAPQSPLVVACRGLGYGRPRGSPSAARALFISFS